MQAEQRKNKHDDDDQTDQVNYSVHDFLRTTDERALNHPANSSLMPKFLLVAAIFVLQRVIAPHRCASFRCLRICSSLRNFPCSLHEKVKACVETPDAGLAERIQPVTMPG
jgi:hypothetical protein